MRLQPDVAHERHEGVEDLGHAAAEGRGVDVQDLAALEPLGELVDLAHQFLGNDASVVGQRFAADVHFVHVTSVNRVEGSTSQGCPFAKLELMPASPPLTRRTPRRDRPCRTRPGGLATPEAVTIASDGVALAGRLFRPAGPARGALLVCHGAGSRKENHELMGEQAAAAGLAALTFDFRGHGESWRRDGAGRLAGRRGRRRAAPRGVRRPLAGGARGQHGRVHAAAGRARPPRLLPLARAPLPRGRRIAARRAGRTRDATRTAAPGGPQGREYSARFDAAALRPFLEGLDLVAAARGLPRVLLAHARDDDAVPFAHSERLAAVLAPPSQFICLGEGGHHGPGRSPYVARATIDWVLANGRGVSTRSEERGD